MQLSDAILERPAKRHAWLRDRHVYALLGLAFALAMVVATLVLLDRDREVSIKGERVRASLMANVTGSHLNRTLIAVDNSMQVIGQTLASANPAMSSETSVKIDATTQALLDASIFSSSFLRSMTVTTAEGKVLASSARRNVGLQVDWERLGFRRDLTSVLEPGRLHAGRDLADLMRAAGGSEMAGLGVKVLPLARVVSVNGRELRLLALVDPSYLLGDQANAMGTRGDHVALFDYLGNLLAATPGAGYAYDRTHLDLPMFAALQRDREFGQFESRLSDEPYLLSFRAAARFPMVAVVGMSEKRVMSEWQQGSGKLRWFGFGAALFVLGYTLMLWRSMVLRSRTNRELRRTRDMAEAGNKAKTSFLTTVSHEIRTPMNGVLGMVGLLSKTRLSERQRQFVDAIEESAQTLLSIINDILDFSRIEAGRFELDVSDYELRRLVESTVDLMAGRAEAKGLVLQAFIDPALPASVVGDARRLRQVLLNLVGNAVKFTHDGEIAVSVRCAKGSDGQALVRFETRDTGIGIHADVAARLFQPFTQADSSISRQYGGTGLGLSICSRMIEMMGGQIGVESRIGEGACFWFELPLNPAASQPPQTPQLRLAGVHLLLLDDRPLRAGLLVDQLQCEGAKVVKTSDLDVALQELASATPFDLVVAAPLTGLDACETTRRLRSVRPDLKIVHLLRAQDADAPTNALIESMDATEAANEDGKPLLDVSVRLPARAAALIEASLTLLAGAASRPAEDEAVETVIKQPFKALVVDDNPMNLQVSRFQLESLGYGVKCTSGGPEALEAFDEEAWDVILMDCQMPGMDGYETTRSIRERERARGMRRTVVIAVTANGMEGERERCLAADMDDYLLKPVSTQGLGSKLSEWLNVVA